MSSRRRSSSTIIDQPNSPVYDQFPTHESMLRDRPCITAYYDAIMVNKHLFENKVL